jgi:hypothetical protein
MSDTLEISSNNIDDPKVPIYLNLKGMRERLGELGFELTEYQMKAWIYRDKRLPTFKLAGRCYISKEELDNHIRSKQLVALKEFKSDSKARDMGRGRR